MLGLAALCAIVMLVAVILVAKPGQADALETQTDAGKIAAHPVTADRIPQLPPPMPHPPEIQPIRGSGHSATLPPNKDRD